MGGPEHLVVFITSHQDFCEKIQELQRRNFKVVVLYYGPSASHKPVSITSVADESHDWLTFLKRELGIASLSLAPYDPTAYHGACQGHKPGMTPPPPSVSTRQPPYESRTPSKVTITACFTCLLSSSMCLATHCQVSTITLWLLVFKDVSDSNCKHTHESSCDSSNQ